MLIWRLRNRPPGGPDGTIAAGPETGPIRGQNRWRRAAGVAPAKPNLPPPRTARPDLSPGEAAGHAESDEAVFRRYAAACRPGWRDPPRSEVASPEFRRSGRPGCCTSPPVA